MPTTPVARQRRALAHRALAHRALALRVLVPGCLAAGYLDLARGGTTVGPLLLVAVYLVFVPALLLTP